VACVLDGDTIVMTDCDTGEHIRMLGVDAPEIEHPDQVEECYGPESASYLETLLTGQYVTLRFDAECTDKYERTLAYVYLPPDSGSDKEILVNELVIRQGYAEFYEEFGDILLGYLLERAQEGQGKR
jgi:micrococcal nuclease